MSRNFGVDQLRDERTERAEVSQWMPGYFDRADGGEKSSLVLLLVVDSLVGKRGGSTNSVSSILAHEFPDDNCMLMQ